MKTKYETVEFVEDSNFRWRCVRSKYSDLTLGYCGKRYSDGRRQWLYSSRDDVGYTSQCLLDIAAFLKQLNSKGESDGNT